MIIYPEVKTAYFAEKEETSGGVTFKEIKKGTLNKELYIVLETAHMQEGHPIKITFFQYLETQGKVLLENTKKEDFIVKVGNYKDKGGTADQAIGKVTLGIGAIRTKGFYFRLQEAATLSISIAIDAEIDNSIRYYASYEEYEKRVKEWKNRNILGQLLSQPDPPNLIQAKLLWTERVFKGRPWDHKPIIRNNFKKNAIERIEYSEISKKNIHYKSYFHKHKTYDYFYDVWSNIHYGYVGLSVGLSEDMLLNGADIAQIIDSFGKNSKDTSDDKIAIKIGFSLYYKFGKYAENLTYQDILEALDKSLLQESKKTHTCYENKEK